VSRTLRTVVPVPIEALDARDKYIDEARDITRDGMERMMIDAHVRAVSEVTEHWYSRAEFIETYSPEETAFVQRMDVIGALMVSEVETEPIS
jgi:hypothetical protein